MKHFVILTSASFLFSCAPQQSEMPALAQQPKVDEAIQANAKAQITAKEAAEKPAFLEFVGTYQHWLECVGCLRAQGALEPLGNGVLSIQSMDEKNKTLSFSTLFSGTRKEHKAVFQIHDTANDNKKSSVLEVNTKTFNFSTDGIRLSIDLFDGSPLPKPATMDKIPPFEYSNAHRAKLNFPVTEGRRMEYPSEALENASVKLLQTKDVENLKAIDLEIMKNTIYARHGTAFKDVRMREFFSINDWYQPIFTIDEASKKLTDIEIKNISLIGRFEKHAKRYYEFGR